MKYILQVAAGIMLASPFESFASIAKEPLNFYHTHTGENLRINYSREGFKPVTLKKFNNFLRDFRTGDIHPIDPALLDILYSIQRETGCRGVIEIISAYRSPETNKRLRSNSVHVAAKSLHMKGQALDVRLRDLATSELRDVAISLGKGGVGYYAQSDFVHIDTGKFRIW